VTHISTKTYGHNIGLSAAFRQWRAESHCRFIHGYALQVRLEFEADDLDQCNWVVDFGGLKSFKTWLENTFDHKLLVAEDDPYRHIMSQLSELGLAELVFVPATGCEAFAKLIYECGEIWLKDNGYKPRVRMRLVEVSEHGANSAIYMPRQQGKLNHLV
jgi:6-pyruvoyltetrahydropterin/6-carboxytetrahydropterin synthase